jgi:choline dehydrogenase-like flavoprotein
MHTYIMAGKSELVSAGQHQAGTCRMGTDPKASVVNRDCQLHDVDNVFVIDSSVHVTNGGFNPALTIMAIAYYASASLVRNWKGTGFRS